MKVSRYPAVMFAVALIAASVFSAVLPDFSAPLKADTDMEEEQISENLVKEYESGIQNLVEGQDYVSGELLVVFDESENQNDNLDNLEALNLEVRQCSDDAVLVAPAEGATLDAAVSAISDIDSVEHIQPNYIYRLDSYECSSVSLDDAYSENQFYLDQINLEGAWNRLKSVSHTKIRVAVIDSGFSFNNDCSINETLSVDITKGKDENGKYAACEQDELNHGTGCVSIIGASANNAAGIAGITSLGLDEGIADIVMIKVFKDGCGYATSSDIAKALEYAVSSEVGARVINMSFGMGISQARDYYYSKYIEAAKNSGAICVAAGGNNGSGDGFTYPADDPNVISVASLETVVYPGNAVDAENFRRAKFSNYNTAKDISAPGTYIYAYYGSKTGYAWSSGTSFSAPIITGVIALMLSAAPQMDFDDVYSILAGSACDITYSSGYASETAGEGFDIYTGYGLVDAAKAVDFSLGIHDLVSEKSVAATCTECGHTGCVYCSVCGYVAEESHVCQATGHISEYSVVTTQPTFNSKGVISYYCSECKELLRTENISCLRPCSVTGIKTASAGSGLKITWEKADGATSYRVYRSTTGKKGTYKLIAKTAKLYYTDTAAESGNEYYYVIKSYNSHSGRYSDNTYTVTKGLYIEKPEITKIAGSATGITLKWSKSEGAERYYVYRSTSGKSGTYKRLGYTTKNYCTDKTAKKGVKYYYVVRACRLDSSKKVYSSYTVSAKNSFVR